MHVRLLKLQIRPDAVALVDAWGLPDELLNSALGSYDGDVYNRLYTMAKEREPLNKFDVRPTLIS